MYCTESGVDEEMMQRIGVWHDATGPIFGRGLPTRVPFERCCYGDVIGPGRFPDAEHNPSAGHKETMDFPQRRGLAREELEALLAQDDVE
jgi:hypothetical protein